MRDRKEDFRRQFGTVWRMASSGFDTLREVVVRSSQAGKLRVDLALLHREKQHLLQQLGAEVATLLDEGALEVPEELRQLHERIRDLDARIKADASHAHDNAFGAPRGYEPEAGNYEQDEPDDQDDVDSDEHAELAVPVVAPEPKKRRVATRKGDDR